jgi:neurotransmitter:Na+ symporter, NSS family
MISGPERPEWGTRIGFVLAATGSAVGLGNIWKFPYIAGENGGGWFVLIYLACVALVGLPIMVAEIMLGRASRQSPVGAYEFFRRGPAWTLVGWLGVAAGFVILSYYSIVAGWSLSYVWGSLGGAFSSLEPAAVGEAFDALYASAPLNLVWHTIFMTLTVAVVLGGVRRGIEATCNVLMPGLLAIIVLLVGYSVTLPGQGFARAVEFIFVPHAEKLGRRSVLEALGHAFFTLSLGMGAMLTYGSYLKNRRDVLRNSLLVSGFDTLIALLACMMIYPVMFAFGQAPQAGPGLVFKSLPVLFAQLPGGRLLSLLFFLLLALAALSSAISLLEVVVATLIDRLGWLRRRATLLAGAAIFLFGVPSALAGSGLLDGWTRLFGANFFDTMDYLASNWMLPLGGLLIALFAGWALTEDQRREAFGADEHAPIWYAGFRLLLRWVAPVLVLVVLLHKVGVLHALGLLSD